MSQEAPGRLEVVRLFVNSVEFEEETEELSSPDALQAWLDERELGPVGRATAADLERAIAVREAIRELLLAQHGDYEADPSAAGIVEQAARRAHLEVRFDAGGIARVAPGGTGVDAALGRLLAIIADAQADGTWERMKACPWETCRWAFYDRSKNRSGVWCDMAVCGNRAKARAFRERQAARRRPD